MDEFLGGAGEGRFVLLGKRAGRTEPKRKFVSARRDILITNVEERDGTELSAAREIREAAATRGRKRADLDANRGS